MRHIYRQTLVDMLKKSIGGEAAEKVVLQAAISAGIARKQAYSPDEFSRICDELKKRGGTIRTIATIASDTTYTTVYYQKEMVRERGQKESLARVSEVLEQKVAERTRQLHESEEKYRVIFENTGTATVILEEDLTISLANSEFTRLSGYSVEELAGKRNWLEFFPEEDHLTLKSDPKAETGRYAFRFHDRKGGIRQVFVTLGSIPGTTKRVASLLDVTAYKRLEAQLIQAQKMQAVGLLAGGIAHDFNNILTAILGYGTLMRMKTEAGHAILPYIDQIISSAERAAALTHGLLAFSRNQEIAPKPVNINDIIVMIEKLLRRLIGEDIELQTELCPENLLVMADSSQIEQVLMNLATNARHAMPGGGSLAIRTVPVLLDDDYVHEHGLTKPGRYLLLMVSDTGTGMNEATQERIFEPFFTTKEPNQGTGLGLSIVYGIVKQHDGHIDCYSEPGVGTVFKIYLPLTESAAEAGEAVSLPAIAGGSETILVAEDEPGIRIVINEILTEFGYTVLEAANGKEAITVFREHGNRIDLLILDVIMPRLNGMEALHAISRMRPGIRAIFMSGHPADILHRKGILNKEAPFLLKPLSPHTLLTTVREVLDATQRKH
jgi:PAS domain S-box-containing protein